MNDSGDFFFDLATHKIKFRIPAMLWLGLFYSWKSTATAAHFLHKKNQWMKRYSGLSSFKLYCCTVTVLCVFPVSEKNHTWATPITIRKSTETEHPSTGRRAEEGELADARVTTETIDKDQPWKGKEASDLTMQSYTFCLAALLEVFFVLHSIFLSEK